MNLRTIASAFLLLLTGIACAQQNGGTLHPNTIRVPDASAYLPAPPDTSSIAFLNDFNRYQWGKGERTKERGVDARYDCYVETDSILVGFAPYVGFTITAKDMPQTFKLLDMVCSNVRRSISGAKDKYMRKRPYVQFNEHPDNRDDEEELRYTGSYPSGHAVRGWAVALVLSELIPDRAEGLLTRGYQYGESRVIEGYHYQSDVDAAMLAASGAVATLHSSPDFQEQVVKARKEITDFHEAMPELTVVKDIKQLAPQEGNSMQGMAIDGDYLVSLQNSGVARIYRLPDLTPVTKPFNLGSGGGLNHANVAAFGTERCSKSDPLPLLYVSQCSGQGDDRDACYVERLSLRGSSKLVQTIKLENRSRYFGGALCWTVDRENNVLIAYGNTISNTAIPNRFRVCRFHMPKLSDGAVVTLRMSDAIDNVIIQDYDTRYPSVCIMQGACVHNGLLYMPTGFGEAKFSSMVYVWDLEQKRIKTAVDLQSQVTDELEDMDFYNGHPVIQCNSRAIIVEL